MDDIYSQLREALRKDGRSMYRISIDTGIPQPRLSRFMAGRDEFRPDILEQLAGAVGREFVLRPKKTTTKSKDR
jgi:hypothetical protein